MSHFEGLNALASAESCTVLAESMWRRWWASASPGKAEQHGGRIAIAISDAIVVVVIVVVGALSRGLASHHFLRPRLRFRCRGVLSCPGGVFPLLRLVPCVPALRPCMIREIFYGLKISCLRIPCERLHKCGLHNADELCVLCSFLIS